ncbi:MAG: hypothetical protein AAF911_09160 [Planctomycetota bacterium]
MPTRNQRYGFNLVGLLIAITLIAIAIALILPMMGGARRTARSMSNNTQVRGIHQSFVTFAQSNKVADQDGFFPGLDRHGAIVADGEATGFSGSGATPGSRMWMLLEGHFFTPDYILNPADTRAIEVGLLTDSQHYASVKPENYSYAVHFITGTVNETTEWSETLNGNAIVLSDRAIGTNPSDISSVWTDPRSGDWRGGVTKNDNSSTFETKHIFADTQYGEGDDNPRDDLFADDHDADDAFLVHEDAVTAYSAD